MMIFGTHYVVLVLGLLDVILKLRISAMFVISIFKQYFVSNMDVCLCPISVTNFTRPAPLVH